MHSSCYYLFLVEKCPRIALKHLRTLLYTFATNPKKCFKLSTCLLSYYSTILLFESLFRTKLSNALFQVEACVNMSRDAVKNGKCVVIGLQSTGEARTLEQLDDCGGELTDFVSTAK